MPPTSQRNLGLIIVNYELCDPTVTPFYLVLTTISCKFSFTLSQSTVDHAAFMKTCENITQTYLALFGVELKNNIQKYLVLPKNFRVYMSVGYLLSLVNFLARSSPFGALAQSMP